MTSVPMRRATQPGAADEGTQGSRVLMRLRAPDRPSEQAAEEENVEQIADRRSGVDRRQTGTRSRLMLVDAHTLFRRGVRQILEMEPDFEVVGEAGNGRDALALAQEITPDVILMDL